MGGDNPCGQHRHEEEEGGKDSYGHCNFLAWKVHLYGIKCNGDRGSGTCADKAARMLISTLASKLINRFGGNFCP